MNTTCQVARDDNCQSQQARQAGYLVMYVSRPNCTLSSFDRARSLIVFMPPVLSVVQVRPSCRKMTALFE